MDRQKKSESVVELGKGEPEYVTERYMKVRQYHKGRRRNPILQGPAILYVLLGGWMTWFIQWLAQ